MDEAEKLWFYIKTKDLEEVANLLERKKAADIKKVRFFVYCRSGDCNSGKCQLFIYFIDLLFYVTYGTLSLYCDR